MKKLNRDLNLVGSSKLVKGANTIVDATGNVVAPVVAVASTGIASSVSGLFGAYVPLTVQQALTAAGAVNITSYYTTVATSGAIALTLADSTVKGQVKKVQMITDGGDATLTFNGTSTVVFADVGDTVELVWNGSDWIPVALYNCADGATAPVYTA